ncbi:MAG: TIGR01777 family oxidoreductase [Campylobacterales bacterium]|nr:TIGR01777 family oxidoreductase [Campylobacterales bacterium]
MKVAISGAGGFIGSHLVAMFLEKGAEVLSLHTADFTSGAATLAEKLCGADVVLHLAGASINKRWTEDYKKVLYASRIDTTRKIVAAMGEMQIKPKLFVCTSAVGVYASSGRHNEEHALYAEDFLGRLVKDWEHEAMKGKTLGIRTVIFRYGIVLGHGGGILDEMVLPFKLGLGGTIGDGSQNFSWVHLHDLMRAYLFVLEHPEMEGVYNLMAPNPTTNYGLTKALGAALHRPAPFAIPRFLLALRFGAEAAEALASGQYATSKRLPEAGFEFEFKTIETAINNLYGRSKEE